MESLHRQVNAKLPVFWPCFKLENKFFNRVDLRSRQKMQVFYFVRRSGLRAHIASLAAFSLFSIAQVLPFLLRRMKEDVLNDLPPKIIQDYYCTLTPLQVIPAL